MAEVETRGAVEPIVGLQATYSARYIAFVAAHLQEYESAWLSPGESTRAILVRLGLEYRALNHARPACMCYCNPQTHPRCEAWRIAVGGYGREGGLDVALTIGRTSLVHPPMPSAELLDFARVSAQRTRVMRDRVRFLNGEGMAA